MTSLIKNVNIIFDQQIIITEDEVREVLMPGSETEVLDKIEVQEPQLYNVILLNDDATPMPFVVQILIEIFNHNSKEAFDIMMQIHEKDFGIAGTYYKEIALQKENDVNRVTLTYQYPLQVKVEKA